MVKNSLIKIGQNRVLESPHPTRGGFTPQVSHLKRTAVFRNPRIDSNIFQIEHNLEILH
jgi:hypothetical protein